jgi:iron(III) transport system substrate-binding protein
VLASLLLTPPHAFCTQKEVIVYTALDQVFSEPILSGFEKQTGIRVKAVYDIEATKTTGLVNRLIAEKSHPKCDVFWNNEVIRSIALKRKGVLAPYISPSAREIPAKFKDKEGYWTGFAARARVLVAHTGTDNHMELPTSIFDLAAPEWRGKAAIANPLFGTTATHVAALFSVLGDEKVQQFFMELKRNGIKIVDGNSVVKDKVGSAEALAGFTDTDDVNVGVRDALPIKAIYPDKAGLGTLVIPNTVSLVANSPNPDAGKQLIDYLLSVEVEQKLSFGESVQMPLRKSVSTPEGFVTIDDIRAMDVDFERVADMMPVSTKFVQNLFIR